MGTLLIAIIVLPWYAYELHKLRQPRATVPSESAGQESRKLTGETKEVKPASFITQLSTSHVGLAVVVLVVILGLALVGIATHRPLIDVVLVKIDYSGSWSGALGYDSNTKSINGYGPTTWRVPLSGMRIVTAVIQKSATDGTLTVSITTEDGKVLARESTTAPYGVVTISWKG